MSRKSKKAWVVFNYDWNQAIELYDLFQEKFHDGQTLVVRNALVENAVSHIRLVMEHLELKSHFKDNIVLTDLIDIANEPPELVKLRRIYDNPVAYRKERKRLNIVTPLGMMSRPPKIQINKLMLHPSIKRSTNHEWQPVLDIMIPPLKPIIEHLRKHASA